MFGVIRRRVASGLLAAHLLWSVSAENPVWPVSSCKSFFHCGKGENQRSYNDEGIFKHPNPTLSQDLEILDRGGSSMPSFRHLMGSGSKTPRLEHDDPDIWCKLFPEICEDDGTLGEMMRDDGNVRPEMRHSKFDDGNVGPDCEDGNPECECYGDPEGCSDVTRHNKMGPSKFDSRAFAPFPDEPSGMRHGGKTGYGVPRKEGVGRETTN